MEPNLMSYEYKVTADVDTGVCIYIKIVIYNDLVLYKESYVSLADERLNGNDVNIFKAIKGVLRT